MNIKNGDSWEEDSENQEYTIAPSERKIITQGSDPTISRVCEWIDREKIEIRADFQRQYVWKNKALIKSRLIESVLLGVPIPEIYVAELPNGREVVIDGQQRLLTFHGFKNNQFALKGLTVLKELNGYRFKDLSNKEDPYLKKLIEAVGDLQDKFLDRSIRITKILKESHSDIKFEIFERLNRGSVKLNDQELRNCIFRGNFNDLLKELSSNKDFLKRQGLEENHERMLDRERILRFFALCDKTERNYKAPLKKFLNEYMAEKQNISDKELEQKRELFKKCLDLCLMVFGNIAYKRVRLGDEEGRDGYVEKNINQGIFDIQMCGFAEYAKRDVAPRAQAIREIFLHLVTSDDDFNETIEISTYGTNTVKRRMEMWMQAIREVLILPDQDRRCFTYEEKKRLFDADNICAICKGQIHTIDSAHVDHIERYSEGGETKIRNGRLTHRYCNLHRH
jgi:hypothetical protein